jgi:hypothetical protein
MKHVLTVDDVGPNLNRLFDLGDCMKLALSPGLDTYYTESLKGKLIGLFFAEPSTRTKSSFQAAIKRMGGDYVDILTEWSSTKKGETFEDTLLHLRRHGGRRGGRRPSGDHPTPHGSGSGDGHLDSPRRGRGGCDGYLIVQHNASHALSVKAGGVCVLMVTDWRHTWQTR